jgi:hypothetical protein
MNLALRACQTLGDALLDAKEGRNASVGLLHHAATEVLPDIYHSVFLVVFLDHLRIFAF